MKEKWYVLIILMFMACAVMLNLDLSFQGNSNNDSMLTLENIEALGWRCVVMHDAPSF